MRIWFLLAAIALFGAARPAAAEDKLPKPAARYFAKVLAAIDADDVGAFVKLLPARVESNGTSWTRAEVRAEVEAAGGLAVVFPYQGAFHVSRHENRYLVMNSWLICELARVKKKWRLVSIDRVATVQGGHFVSLTGHMPEDDAAGFDDSSVQGRRDPPARAVRPSRSRVNITKLEVTGGSDGPKVRRRLVRQTERLAWCWNVRREVDDALELGKVAIQFQIGTQGRVPWATASGIHEEIETCVVEILKSLEYPPLDTNASATATLVFAAE